MSDFVTAFRERVASATTEPGMDLTPLASVVDAQAGAVPIRVYRPRAGLMPLVCYVHGAGFIAGDLESHDRICRYLAARVDAVVVAVDYRLAPEHPFPAALQDTVDAVEWVLARAAELEIDPARWGIVGDSAGGTLAAALVQQWSGRSDAPSAQALVCPALELADLDLDSHREFEDAEGFSTAVLRQMIDLYLGDHRDRADPRVSPSRGEQLAGLPPTIMITAELDPLRDDGERYAQRLVRGGVPVTSYRHPAMVHYGVLWCRAAPEISTGAEVVARGLRAALVPSSAAE